MSETASTGICTPSLHAVLLLPPTVEILTNSRGVYGTIGEPADMVDQLATIALDSRVAHRGPLLLVRVVLGQQERGLETVHVAPAAHSGNPDELEGGVRYERGTGRYG